MSSRVQGLGLIVHRVQGLGALTGLHGSFMGLSVGL